MNKHHIFATILLILNVLPAIGQSTEVTDSLTWNILFEQGCNYRQHANSFRAMQCLEQAEKLHPSDTIQRELASCYFSRGQYAKCLNICEDLIIHDTITEDLSLMARCCERMERTEDAFRYYLLAVNRDIENYNNLVSLCQMLINNEQFNDALTLLDRYCAIDSTNASVNVLKAYALHKLQRFDEAIDMYETLKMEGDNRSTTNYYLGLSYMRRGNVAEAYDLLKMAVDQTDRQVPSILSRFGMAELALQFEYVNEKNYKRPVRDTLSIIDFFAWDPYTTRSFKDNEQRWLDSIHAQGVEDIKEAITLMQPDGEQLSYLYIILGDQYTKTDLHQAVSCYKKALESDPTNQNVYYQLAYSHHLLKDTAKEKSYYEQFLKVAGDKASPDMLRYARSRIEKCTEELFMQGKKLHDRE